MPEVSATYSLIPKAKTVKKEKNQGRLKVSFLGPFYAGYNVIAIDPSCRYVMVAGNNLKYFWLLSREKTIPAAIQTAYLKQAQALGYDVSKLIWTKHDRHDFSTKYNKIIQGFSY